MMILPVDSTIRSDSQGDGNFLAPRGGRLHHGVDLVVIPGTQVVAPADGVVRRLGKCYSTSPQFDLVEIESGHMLYRILYLKPGIKAGHWVEEGAPIGIAQDVRDRHGTSMTPHVHLEVLVNPVKLQFVSSVGDLG